MKIRDLEEAADVSDRRWRNMVRSGMKVTGGNVASWAWESAWDDGEDSAGLADSCMKRSLKAVKRWASKYAELFGVPAKFLVGSYEEGVTKIDDRARRSYQRGERPDEAQQNDLSSIILRPPKALWDVVGNDDLEDDMIAALVELDTSLISVRRLVFGDDDGPSPVNSWAAGAFGS